MTKKLKMENNNLKNKFSSLSREERIKVLLDYANECYKNWHKPSKKEIRKKFHVEIYNYFENTPDYHRKSGIPVSLRNYKKEEARRLIMDFVQNKAKEGHYSNRKEVERDWNIHLSTYFKNLKDLYDSGNIDYSLVQKEIKRKILLPHTYTKDELEKQRQLIKGFIQKSVLKGFYPSVHHIQKKLNLSFYNLYDGMLEAYKDAQVNYERPSPILLGKKKEEVLTRIAKELLVKMGFKINRISIESAINFNRYADMALEDDNGIKYLIEIKAYREDYSIGRREFQQLLDYLKKENLFNGIFITTSNTKKCNFESIQFINGKTLIELLKTHRLDHYIKQIKWIQKSRVNSKEREKYKITLKNKIVGYTRLKNNMPTKKEIQKEFGIDLRTIFGRVRPYEKLSDEAKN